MLKGLTARGHRLIVFAACQDAREKAEALAVFPEPDYALHCFEYARLGRIASKIAALHKPQSYIYSHELKSALHRTLQEPYDVLHLEQQWSGWLTRPSRPGTVLSVQSLFRLDCPNPPVAGLLERLRYRRMRAAEAALLRTFPRISTLSAEMSAEVRLLNPHAAIHTAPFGMDLGNYPFLAQPPDIRPPVVALIGSFDWLPSKTAAVRLLTRLWPQIRDRVPSARLLIVGRNARSLLAEYVGVEEITIEENVPDILCYFRKASVLLYAPERGSGMKVKVLESFALGIPVVTTGAGVEGIPAKDAVHAGICEDDQGLINRCVALLQDRAARWRQGRAARNLLENHCAADVALDALEEVYGHILADQREKVVV